MDDIGYSGQLYNNKTHTIKVRTGDDILNAAKDAVCGELMVAKGGQFPGLYIATKTSGEDIELSRVSEVTPENKLPIDNDYSLSFDGVDDFVTMGAPSSLDITGDMTLSIWVNTDQNTQYTGLFSKRNGSGRQFYFYLRNDSGNKNLSLQTEPPGGSLSSMNTSGNPVTLNTWHHVAAVINSGVTNGTTIYVDGNAVGTGTMTLASNSTAPLIIGSSTGTGNFFEGLLDEAAIFNSALSTSDVATLYNSGVPGDISSLNPLGWWRMGDNDSGTGTIITDQGSGSNDGTLTNGPTFSTSVPS